MLVVTEPHGLRRGGGPLWQCLLENQDWVGKMVGGGGGDSLDVRKDKPQKQQQQGLKLKTDRVQVPNFGLNPYKHNRSHRH